MLDLLPVNACPGRSATAGLGEICQQSLLQAQNGDGTWPYQRGLGGAVEPTCWALIALKNKTEAPEAIARGLAALRACQLQDGSWPTRPGHRVGCWSTALASLATFLCEGDSPAARRGLNWVCDAWPAEGGLWWQVRSWLRPTAALTRQDSSLRGWSWTPGAASWVEPTAYALILLNAVPENLHPASAAKRHRLGEAMLYDRMCPEGGWNSGNPFVYGVAGERRVGPTVWALLALKAYRGRSENQESLDWLERAYPQISGPASLTLAHLCLKAHGRPPAGLEARLSTLYEASSFLESVPATAFSLMALDDGQNWPPSTSDQSRTSL